MRREFPRQVQRDALLRAAGYCEGMPYGKRCEATLTIGKYHFDHDIPDGLGGEPILSNCVCLCIACHKDKTTKHDIPLIAKAKRISDKHLGIRKTKRPVGSRGFERSKPQRTASRPIERRS